MSAHVAKTLSVTTPELDAQSHSKTGRHSALSKAAGSRAPLAQDSTERQQRTELEPHWMAAIESATD
jgi:hypothetical protein